MQLLPRLCMATGTAAPGEGNSKGDSSTTSSSKLATAVSSSSSSSTVSTSSAAAAAVSEASSSSTSLPSLSSAATASLASSFVHVATLEAPGSSASVVAVGDSADGVVVARPSRVALHDLSTLEETSSTSDPADAAAGAGSVKCAAHAQLRGGAAAVTGHQDGWLRLWCVSSRSPATLRLAAALPTVSDRLRRFPVPSNHVAVRRHHRRLWIEHADAVSGVAASADGRLLFSVSWDKTLKVWALPSLRCLQSLPAHDDAVNAVAAAPDGTVYTASADRRVRVWAPRPEAQQPRRTALGRSKKQHHHHPVYTLVATLARHTAAVNALAVGCGGQALYSGGNDRAVLVWEREDSASHMVAVGALRGHSRAVLSVACAAGGLVVSGAADQTVRAWHRAADGKGYACVAVIDGHAAAVRSVAAAPVPVPVPVQKPLRRADDGGGGDEEWRVCSASFDGEVRVWSLRVVASGL